LVERIKISQTKITTRRADNSISFDTDNLYLKTDPAGTLKAGGYERCPVLTGYGTITEKTALGGFPYLIKAAGGGPVAFSDYLPKGPVTLVQNIGPGFTMFVAYSAECSITQNGNQVGTFKYIYRVSTPNPQLIQQGVYVSLWGIVNVSTYSSFEGGAVTFNRPSTNTLYNADGTAHSNQGAGVTGFECGGFNLLYTSPPVSLSIAVTP
jgi:hypothetical protein